MKIVAFLLVFFGILLAMRWWSALQAKKESKEEAEQKSKEDYARAEAAKADAFVRCVRCDAHVPKREALFAEGQWRCLDSQCAKRRS
jgi:hypothetical protein